MVLRMEIDRLKQLGYSELNAEARLCQDIILAAIGMSDLVHHVTVKGGVVMRNLSRSARRATQDLDIDFIRYPLSDDAIRDFIQRLNCLNDLRLSAIGSFEELNHHDYRGKRVHLKIQDKQGTTVSGKLDIGVHRDKDVAQDLHCFDICFSDEDTSLFMNPPEQVLVEKLKSLLRFGAGSTRYKDIYDIYFLIDRVDVMRVKELLRKYIYQDETLAVTDGDAVCMRTHEVFSSRRFVQRIKRANKNWLSVNEEDVFGRIENWLSLLRG